MLETFIEAFCRKHSISEQTLYIEPGSSWDNAFVESFNGRFRDELSNREMFASLVEAKVLVKEYVEQYNQRRPHSALGYVPPAVYAANAINSSAIAVEA